MNFFSLDPAPRAGGASRPRTHRLRPYQPAPDLLERRAALAVDLAAAPITAAAHATTGLIPVATVAPFPAAGATVTPQTPGTASISWGDGTTSTAIVQVNLVYNDLNDFHLGIYGGPVFDTGAILAAHTYDRPGTYAVVATLINPEGVASTASTTATVRGRAAGGFSATPEAPLTAMAGAATGLVPVATFTESAPHAPRRASTYRATIAWGDGGQSAGVVRVLPATASQPAPTIEVLGSHAYADDFPTLRYKVGATVTLARAGARTSTTTVVDVATGGSTPAPPRVLPTGPVVTQRGRAARSLTVARFQQGSFGGVPDASELGSATVEWGDGTSSAGTIQTSGGVTVYDDAATVYSPNDHAATVSSYVVQVAGRHAYRTAGRKRMTVTWASGGVTAMASTIVRVR